MNYFRSTLVSILGLPRRRNECLKKAGSSEISLQVLKSPAHQGIEQLNIHHVVLSCFFV
jgi:hypothetical protein